MFFTRRRTKTARWNKAVARRFNGVGFRPHMEALEDRLAPCCSTPPPPSLAIAMPDSYSTAENTPVSGDVTDNDGILFNAGFEVLKLADPMHGELTSWGSDGSFTYTPDPGFNGADAFVYTNRTYLGDLEDPFYRAGTGTPATVDITVGSQSNPAPGITVTPSSGLFTTEAGNTAQFSVVLDSQPAADVTIPLSSSDTSEGTVSTSSLTFTPQTGTSLSS